MSSAMLIKVLSLCCDFSFWKEYLGGGEDWGNRPWFLIVQRGDWSNAHLQPEPSGSDLVNQGAFRAYEIFTNTASEFPVRTFQLQCDLCAVMVLVGKYGLFTLGSIMTPATARI